jgi:hypothetical protein
MLDEFDFLCRQLSAQLERSNGAVLTRNSAEMSELTGPYHAGIANPNAGADAKSKHAELISITSNVFRTRYRS